MCGREDRSVGKEGGSARKNWVDLYQRMAFVFLYFPVGPWLFIS